MDALEVLQSEFAAEPGSFLEAGRLERRWDHVAFQRLQRAMIEVCRELAGREALDRWIAEGFWFIERFVRDDCSHSDFPRPACYKAALERVESLSFWLFIDESPYLPSYGWPDI